ncbi:MAG: bifunctional folylpolyglutamate synthase/dihydrofolate synthase [Actinobacteria bacterium]|nr:bifunctional folylpolyglutamate synthase/dihydrofolate synthase [Actinomycetota bacterium]
MGWPRPRRNGSGCRPRWPRCRHREVRAVLTSDVDSRAVAQTEAERYAQLLRRAEAEIVSRTGEGRIHPTRERIEALTGLLGDPQRAYRSIHLTGTNGKTSTARMIDELLRGFGLRTGRFTSPHLSKVNERIVLDGVPVDDRTFVDAYAELAPYLELIDGQFEVKLSFFEVITALAFAIFADAPVDVAVVEVGLGGEWDATNVIDAEIAVVTPIGLDHTEYLGPTTATIAHEKAGIIKPDATAVLAAQPVDAANELIQRAVAVGASVAREGLEFAVLDRQVAVGGQLLTLQGLAGIYDEVFLPLHGAHQAQNAVLALAAVEVFFGAGAATGVIDLDVVRSSFAAVRSPGRLETVRAAPTVLVDAAHNPHGMTATVAALAEAFDFRRLVGVIGVLGDKDVRGMLEVLEPVLDELVVTQNSSARALPVDHLAAIAVEVFGRERVSVEARLDDAIETAVRLAEESDDAVLAGAGVLVTGSVITAGEARVLLGTR